MLYFTGGGLKTLTLSFKLYTLLILPCSSEDWQLDPWVGFCISVVLKICTFPSSSKDLCTPGILRYANTLLSANKTFGIHGIFLEALMRLGLDLRAELPHRWWLFSSLEAHQVWTALFL